MDEAADLKRTSLYEIHLKYGARMVPFGGWEMPVQYEGVIAEHKAVRTAAGLFDVSHMGEFDIRGPEAQALVNYAITNDAARLAVGQALYSPMCHDRGGMVDDVLVYRLEDSVYQMVVNAGNIDKDFAHMSELAKRFPGARLTNRSMETALLALQGPLAQKVLQRLTQTDLSAIAFYHARPGEVAGLRGLISRTGYTGEDGFEVYLAWGDGPALWDAILEAGEDDGVVPAGLGARDTLRFEARLPLYGHELDDNTSPLEAGLGRFVKLDKADFLGKDVLVRQKAEGLKKRLCGFEMVERGVARQGYRISKDGAPVGVVTSGTFSPTLEKNLGLGYVPPDLARVGSEFDVIIRGRPTRAVVVETPFYKRPA